MAARQEKKRRKEKGWGKPVDRPERFPWQRLGALVMATSAVNYIT